MLKISDAKQELLAREIKTKINKLGFSVVEQGSRYSYHERKFYNFTQLEFINGEIYKKNGIRLEINLYKKEGKLLTEIGQEANYALSNELVELCRRYRHATQSNSQVTISKYGCKINKIDNEIYYLIDKAQHNQKLQELINRTRENLKKAIINNDENLNDLKKKLEILNGGIFVKNNFYATKFKESLLKDFEKNIEIARGYKE